MEATKIVIENWPQTNHIWGFIPIFIAVVAVVISLYSAYLTRKSFVMSFRPYVWAVSSVFTNSENLLIPKPYEVVFFVKNSPAMMIKQEVILRLNNEILFSCTNTNQARFPTDERHSWWFEIGQVMFDKIMERPKEDQAKLTRTVSLTYRSLGNSKKYYYELIQLFEPSGNQWRNTSEISS